MSNYEITKNRVQREFVKYDQEKMIEKFGLEHDETYIYIDFLWRKYRIHRVEGIVEWANRGTIWENPNAANFNEVLTIFDVLCDSKEHCLASGEFVNMQSLSSIKGSSGNVGGGLFKTDGEYFDKNTGALAAACEKLGGVQKGKGDVSYEIPIFDFLSFMIQFWNSDEEFEASLQIFVDKNTLQFMRYETMWYAVSHMLSRIKEEMGYGEFLSR